MEGGGSRWEEGEGGGREVDGRVDGKGEDGREVTDFIAILWYIFNI